MRFLRAHHITNLVAVVDSFLPRAAANPKGGRPLILHPNEAIALLLFTSFVAPQRTMKGVYTWAQTYYYRRFSFPATSHLSGSATRRCRACCVSLTSCW